jgi:hypothetical protein
MDVHIQRPPRIVRNLSIGGLMKQIQYKNKLFRYFELSLSWGAGSSRRTDKKAPMANNRRFFNVKFRRFLIKPRFHNLFLAVFYNP